MSDTPDFSVIAKSMAAAAKAIRPTLMALGEKLIEFGKVVDQMMWDAYEEAGFPYGPNYAGRDRWLTEMGEANRLREQADDIVMRHEMAADLRRILKRDED